MPLLFTSKEKAPRSGRKQNKPYCSAPSCRADHPLVLDAELAIGSYCPRRLPRNVK